MVVLVELRALPTSLIVRCKTRSRQRLRSGKAMGVKQRQCSLMAIALDWDSG